MVVLENWALDDLNRDGLSRFHATSASSNCIDWARHVVLAQATAVDGASFVSVVRPFLETAGKVILIFEDWDIPAVLVPASVLLDHAAEILPEENLWVHRLPALGARPEDGLLVEYVWTNDRVTVGRMPSSDVGD